LAGETSLQLLTLKLLYLIFTTPSTQEYFYTNDLHVLVDILIRNLLDLPSDAAALRHTYLRVLYPMLAYTQLKQPPHYKCEEIRKLLSVLAGGQPIEEHGHGTEPSGLWGHFEEVDETTKRLVTRCRTVIWLKDPETPESDIRTVLEAGTPISPVDIVSAEKVPPLPPIPRKLRKRNPSSTGNIFLAPQLESARESALSVVEVAAQREKPGVMTPSRKASLRGAASRKEKPMPPKARRSTWSRRAKDVDPSAGEDKTADPEASVMAEGSIQHEDAVEGAIAVQTISGSKPQPADTKQPPPAPKARRWRGIHRKKDDEGSNNTAPDHNPNPNPSTKIPPPCLTIPPEKTLSGTNPSSARASVAEALSIAQAEAMESINEALERATLSPPPPTASSPTELKTVVLTPPSPAPPRAVPGPTLSLERSPFIGDDEDD
jgi:Protein of unknown function (DUF2013)